MTTTSDEERQRSRDLALWETAQNEVRAVLARDLRELAGAWLAELRGRALTGLPPLPAIETSDEAEPVQ